MNHSVLRFAVAALLFTGASFAQAGSPMMFKAKISGTVLVQLSNSPTDGQIVKTKLDNKRVFQEFGVSDSDYELVWSFDGNAGLELVAKSLFAKLPVISVLPIGDVDPIVDTHTRTFALIDNLEDGGALGNLFEGITGGLTGTVKYRGDVMSPEISKISLTVVATGNNPAGTTSHLALINAKISTSGLFTPQ
ncbi:MAG TPA: hypothetical protein VMR50_08880 [Myxococcota bacterium]|nr:hypothetical protein [Myxococcota bacterium]